MRRAITAGQRTTRLISLLSVSALAVGGVVATTGASAPAADQTPEARVDTTRAQWIPGLEDQYTNPVDAQFDLEHTADPAQREVLRKAQEDLKKTAQKTVDGNPKAAAQLASIEAEAKASGKSPAQVKSERSGRPKEQQQKAKLLTLLVEFDENANDDFSGAVHPPKFGSPAGTPCVTDPPGTVKNGPLHNNIPQPNAATDNNSIWLKDFGPDYYNKILFSKKGYTERLRTDLTGPDGKPGVDISGYTMKNMYEEMSKGKYTVDGEAVGWIKVPHSEAYYGMTGCDNGKAKNQNDNTGSPLNPKGPQQLPIDAVNTLAKQDPGFKWADYDKEDIGDADGDGNTQEPDGVIDHLNIVHAGKDKSGGGGKEGIDAVWAHASTVLFGHDIPGTDKKIANYIIQPEDSGVGVFAHEYGHDLGLPDLYDNFSGGDNDINFWDLMSSGSHSGPLFQTMPGHMGIWDKYSLGWLEPAVVKAGMGPQAFVLGQAAKTPWYGVDGVRVNLPDKKVEVGKPHSGKGMWYSGNDQEWADTAIVRDLKVPAGGDVKFSMWNDYVIEQDWDYGFVEVSLDGGKTWTQLEVKDAAGNLVTTPADYPDPQHNLSAFRKKFGLTGDSGGWRNDLVDLTPYAGKDIKLRLDLNTDAAFMEKGWFADDFALIADGKTVWSDDVEKGENGWTQHKGTNSITKGNGWGITDGTFQREQYYLLEWRNFSGFDEGLKYTYTAGQNGRLEKVKYNAPGMLVWLKDGEYQNNGVNFNIKNGPSYGPKGSLLLVDSHYDPLRYTGAAGEALSPTNGPKRNVNERVNSSNVAFGFEKTYGFKSCVLGTLCNDFGPQAPVTRFDDSLGYYPGVEYGADGKPVLRERYGSLVLPAKAPYTTRAVTPDGKPDTAHYGTVFEGSKLGNGLVGKDKAYGVTVDLVAPLPNGTGAFIWVNPAKK